MLFDSVFVVLESNREMGWKAAEKLIRHWKVLSGDNVSQAKPNSPSYIIVAYSFPLPLFHFEMIIINIIESFIYSIVTGYDNKGQR